MHRIVVVKACTGLPIAHENRKGSRNNPTGIYRRLRRLTYIVRLHMAEASTEMVLHLPVRWVASLGD